MSGQKYSIELVKGLLLNLTADKKASPEFKEKLKALHDSIQTGTGVSDQQYIDQLTEVIAICETEKNRIKPEIIKLEAQKKKMKDENNIRNLDYVNLSTELNDTKYFSDILQERIDSIKTLIDK